MTRDDVKNRHARGVVFDTHVMANPANIKEWIVFFKKGAGKSFFLVNDMESVESFAHLDDVVDELKLLGIKRIEVPC